jgi:hypothetical protein
MELIQGGVATVGLSLAAGVDSYLDEVTGGGLTRLSDADVLAELRELESARRRLASAGHAMITELDRRGLPGRLAMRSTSALLQGLLRLSPFEATRRVDAGRALGRRAALTGPLLAPLLPAVAAAQAAGDISGDHVQVILACLEKFPPGLSSEQFTTAEQTLTDIARTLPPRQVALAGQRYLAHLDPDGTLTDQDEAHRRREFQMHPLPDGRFDVRGTLTATCGAQLIAALTPRAAPRPDDAGGPDPRSYGQRMHDALDELASITVSRGELTRTGAPAQVIITMTQEQYRTRKGLAETSFGQPLTVQAALTLAEEAILTGLVLAADGAVLKLGQSQRIASRKQTLALTARDKGCSFPGCEDPPEWCQRHHVIPWWLHGPTDIDNLTLVCRYHHREFEKTGWRCVMINGMPWWIPPAWRDPDQTPQQNHRITQRR